jgi:beta-glucanase (GH16 family)
MSVAPILHVLESLAAVTNPAVAIILFTVAVRLLISPLTYLQVRSERRRAADAPKLKELLEKHRDDPAALQQAVGFGPLLGLLPALAQAPFFMLMFSVTTHSGFGGLMAAHLLGAPLVVGALLALAAALAWWSARQMPPESPRWLRFLPYLSLPAVVYLPVAGGIYLVTSAAWTALERAVLRRNYRRTCILTMPVNTQETLARALSRRPWKKGRPMRIRTRRLLAVAATAVALTGSAAFAVTANAALPPPPSGWTQVWADDFTGAANTLPNSGNWIIDTGTQYPGGPAQWGTGEIQTYTNSTSNVAHDGAGNLRITPIRNANGQWTSSRIETQRTNFKAPAGGVMRIEGRIQMPNVTGAQASGYWPAFWALGAPYRGNYQNWPAIGEFDIMENVNGINSVWGVLHCGVNPGGPCNETLGLGASRACPGSTCQSAFHTYAFEWDRSSTPNALRWYVDGQQYHQVTQSQIGEPHWSTMTSHAGYFLLLNVAMGGAFPNGVAGSATPTGSTVSGRPMLVDYVAVYTRGGSTTPPSTPPTTTPPPSGTRDAYAQIQAESYNSSAGVQKEACSEGGENVAYIGNGDWMQYDNVEFGSGGVRDFVARVASGAGGGVSGLLEVRVDSRGNAPIGSFAVGNTGGWQTWRSVPGNAANVSGRHTVFLTFTSGQPNDFVNVNWFQFRR